MTNHRSRQRTIVQLAIGALLSAAVSALSGQTLKGTILGTITDSSQAVLPHAQISVTEVNTNFHRSEITNDEGFYVFANLDPGAYRIEPGGESAKNNLSRESIDKTRDVLSSILGSAVKYGYLVSNPAAGLQVPPEKRGKRRHKPFIRPEEFVALVVLISEPYATMVYVAVYTGLRISELIGLRWNDVHERSITIDERFCRGDWGEPKSDA